MPSYIIGIEFKRECEGDKNEMASRWCRNVFNDWHFIWLRTRSSPKPNDNSCSDWDWDDELGVWQCDDSSSGYRGHYFYGGRYYQNKSTFKNSSAFKSYQSSAEFKGGMEVVQREDLGAKICRNT